MGQAPGHGGEASRRQAVAPGIPSQPPTLGPRSPALYPPSHASCVACPFCDLAGREVLAENFLAVAFLDGYPVSPGHTLIVPRRHVASWFDATREEQLAILELAERVKAQLDADGAVAPASQRGTRNAAPGTRARPDGYDLGLNVGEAGGQTVPHLHLHPIPRSDGDVDDPTGGERFVLPSTMKYRNPGFIPGTEGAWFVTEADAEGDP